ncbi:MULTISPECIES: hypothetical protein [Rossellomorea]|nr:hypothetical protein [Rossellomorea aquimaris]
MVVMTKGSELCSKLPHAVKTSGTPVTESGYSVSVKVGMVTCR